ncbi:MAG: TonB family protein [Bryobacteraceae bacterium]
MKYAVFFPMVLSAAAISGRVYDGSGAVVAGAPLLLSRGAEAPVKGASGADGAFRFESLTPGAYRLTAAVPGFMLFQRGVTVGENSDASVAVILKLGGVEETIEVRAPGQAKPQVSMPHRTRVGGNMQPVRLLKRVPPVYPETARAAGIEGTVVLRAIISTEGKVLSTAAFEGAAPALAAAAQDAVRQWEYEPARLNGVAVEVLATVEVRFWLK